jgi:hypothetical protein
MSYDFPCATISVCKLESKQFGLLERLLGVFVLLSNPLKALVKNVLTEVPQKFVIFAELFKQFIEFPFDDIKSG